jgi:hypothetical protein
MRNRDWTGGSERWRDDDDDDRWGERRTERGERGGEMYGREGGGARGYGTYGPYGGGQREQDRGYYGGGGYGGGYGRRSTFAGGGESWGREFRGDDAWMDRGDYPSSFGSGREGRYEPRGSGTGFYGRMGERGYGGGAGYGGGYERETWRGRERDDDRGLLERAGDWIQRKIAGKPPKGYRRSDDRIREDVCDLIMRRSDIDASEVEVTVSNAEVTLAGTVHDRAHKRRLEDIAEDVLGVDDVHNHIRVQREKVETTTERPTNGDRDRVTTRPGDRTRGNI